MIESYLDLLLAQNLADAAFLTLYVPPFEPFLRGVA